MMMDLEFGSNSSCVILSLMGLDERPIKKHVQGHKRVLSDEYHQRVASTASHVRRSSCKRYSFVAIFQNKRCKISTEDEEMLDVLSDERNALALKGFVDEFVSETYSSRYATRHFEGSLRNSYMSRPFSRSSSVSTVIYRRSDSKKRNEALHQRSTDGEFDRTISEKSNQEGDPLEHDNKIELLSQKSQAKISSMLEDIEQLSADSFDTNGSSIEVDCFKNLEDYYQNSPDSVLEPFDDEKAPELSEDGTHLQSLGFNPSTAQSGETKTTSSADKDRKDHCGTSCSEQDKSKPMGINGNREFNYLVDILTTAGFCRKDLEGSVNKWHSVESPLSPFIFEAVEKRYTDDKSWEISERLLIFDHINSQLEEILRPSMLVSSRLVSKRISHQFCRLSEDILWSSLVKEARELKGETIEDLVERDLGSINVGGLIESIVTEIERAVINEIVSELVQ